MSRSFPFVGDIYIYKGNLSFLGCLTLYTRKRKMIKSLETLVALADREGKDLDLLFLSITVLFLVASL